MFILKSINGPSFGLLNNKTYIIGRDGANICLDDKSVSRKHAEITIKDNDVHIKDLRSSNYTMVNSTSLQAHKLFKLKVGSQIQFGKDSVFLLQKEKLVITMSSLDTPKKVQCRELTSKLNGEIVQCWSPEVTHVVISTFVLTKKVVCALIKKQYIVLPGYLESRWQKIANNLHLPDEKSFQIMSFEDKMRSKIDIDYNLDRSRLFHKKVFIFINKETMLKMEEIVVLAGGRALSVDCSKITRRNIDDTNMEHLLLINDGFTQNVSPVFDDLMAYNLSLKRRSIPIQELALAIVYGSTETYCNSYFDKLQHVMRDEHREIVPGAVLVPETQTESQAQACSISEVIEIDETPEEIPRPKRVAIEVLQVESKRPKNNETLISTSAVQKSAHSSNSQVFKMPTSELASLNTQPTSKFRMKRKHTEMSDRPQKSNEINPFIVDISENENSALSVSANTTVTSNIAESVPEIVETTKKARTVSPETTNIRVETPIINKLRLKRNRLESITTIKNEPSATSTFICLDDKSPDVKNINTASTLHESAKPILKKRTIPETTEKYFDTHKTSETTIDPSTGVTIIVTLLSHFRKMPGRTFVKQKLASNIAPRYIKLTPFVCGISE